ncbi:MAG: ABC transporter ATP-binding protein [Candidatus Aenigmarchaeota archaeon]|nr:ABC transporter ATP-binding protein [Candidatus Aenigmarchaeota archaeon]
MSETVLEVQDIVKTYNQGLPNEIKVLKEVSMKINKGDFVSIVGPSGSGKTTLLDIIGCLMRPTSGGVFVDGVDVKELGDSELANIRGNKIGFVFQQYNLIQTITAQENVEIALRIMGKSKGDAKKRAKELLELVGLGKRLNNKPSQMSGGEQQRVAIARALANNPSIILGDEPTGNLDTKTGEKILNLLKKLNNENGYTIVVVSHDPNVTEYVDYTIHIRDGEIEKTTNGTTTNK